VPESYVRYIHINDPVQVSVPSLNHTFPGKVSRFSVDVKEETRTMHTEVDVPNPNHLLVPGLYAEATLTLEGKGDAVAVPLQAVDQQSGKVTVDLVDSSNKIEIRQVVLGIQTATHAEVVSGLQEGDMVVVSDRSSLRAGQVVQPKPIELTQYQGSDDNK
jgi:RND family efflux transporter MFP subunit